MGDAKDVGDLAHRVSGVAGLNAGFDLAGGKGDNSFGQGTKEDDPNVSVITGSIPPNKSGLTRFYEASEFSSVNNHNFVYLGWERTNVLGTANFDFEINQKTQPDLTTTDRTSLALPDGCAAGIGGLPRRAAR
jgi:hypothetical protein